MSYSLLQRKKVQELRRQGHSLNEIVRITGIPKSTLRGWIKNLILTPEQTKKLGLQSFLALQRGRRISQEKFSRSRNKKEIELLSIGEKEIGKLTKRELFIAGVALYWAEGFKNKHEKRLGFCNSDPKMIRFYLSWLNQALGVEKDQVTARLTINTEHKDREAEILLHWANITGISSSNFTKTFYQSTVLKKKYPNRNEYYGVLRLHVKESLNHLLKMRGWIVGLGNFNS